MPLPMDVEQKESGTDTSTSFSVKGIARVDSPENDDASKTKAKKLDIKLKEKGKKAMAQSKTEEWLKGLPAQLEKLTPFGKRERDPGSSSATDRPKRKLSRPEGVRDAEQA